MCTARTWKLLHFGGEERNDLSNPNIINEILIPNGIFAVHKTINLLACIAAIFQRNLKFYLSYILLE